MRKNILKAAVLGAAMILALLGSAALIVHSQNISGANGSGVLRLPITNIGTSGLTGTSPITISAAGAIACPTCATSSSVLNRVRQATVSADGSTQAFNISGDLGTLSGTPGVITPTATSGPGISTFSSATGVVSGVTGLKNYRTGRNIKIQIIASAAGKITDERWWFGLTDQAIATQGASDNPAGNYAAFRFSTNASDTVWQAITKDGTTQTIISTGVAPIINTPQIFAIIFDDTVPNVQFFIGGVSVGTSTTHLPSASTNLGYVISNLCFASTTSNGVIIEQVFTAVDF